MKPKPQTNLFNELIVDNFAGGGGTSTGVELATGRPVDIAINHDPDAILMHKTNHPYPMVQPFYAKGDEVLSIFALQLVLAILLYLCA